MTAISDKTAADSHQIIAELKRKLDERTSERDEALERQTATAEILKVIASSRSDVQPVFEAIATSAKRLIGGFSTTVFSIVDDVQHLSALTPTSPAADAALKARFPAPLSAQPWAEQIRNGEIVNVADIEIESAVPADLQDVWRMRGFRALLLVPLRRDRASIGMISLTRREPGTFAVHDVQLLQTFADQAVIAIENARLFGEVQARTHDLHESLTYQTAISNVLNVISRSPSDILTVLDTIAETAQHLCQSEHAYIFRLDGDNYHLVAARDVRAERIAFLRDNPIAPNRGSTVGRVALERRPIHVMDALADTEYKLSLVGHGGRTILGVPLLRDGIVIGVIVLTRGVVRPFVERQIELVTTFADQAVIAIENARLFNETKESLERQTATADILKVIASSPSDVQPVFEAIAINAKALIGGFSATVFRFVDGIVNLVAYTPISPAADQFLIASFPRPTAKLPFFELAKGGEVVQEADCETNPDAGLRDIARARGFRSSLFAPLMSKGTPIGLIVVTRKEPGTFAEHHVQLLETFADQAVIAIENVRLFDEVQAKTRDLSEALVYQTGSGNILKVIASSPTDVGPVLKAIVESACELCDAVDAIVLLNDGNGLSVSAHHGPIPLDMERWQISRKWTAGRAFLERKPVHVHDLLSPEGDEFPDTRQRSARTGTRSILSVPLLSEGKSIGTIVLRRTEVHPFSDKQIKLLQTFADQAVIAIGNVRLFDEVQAKTRDLTESLEFQMATSDVLKVISRSPDALQPVLDVIVETSRVLCNALTSVIFLLREDKFHDVAESSEKPDYIEALRANPIPLNKAGSVLARAAREKRTIHVANTAEDPEFGLGGPLDQGGPRSLLSVPLIQDGRVIGGITLRQSYLTPFTPRQIEAVETFADQAVIAISNVNLFEQVQQRTRELAASLDDLRTAQDRLVQTEKLASLGQLTAGIAHEIKNPLNFVNNFSALSAELVDELNDMLKPAALENKMRLEVDDLTQMLKGNLEKVVQHGKRADSIVKNMLLHSREGSGEHRPTDINALLDESLNLAYHGARAEKSEFNITLQRHFDARAGMIELFPQEITRAFLNLISNGFYAATKRKAEIGNSGFEPALSATTKNKGNAVEIRIRDNGTGIPAEVKEKMFNPFFTTKPAGEGTGLGLSMSHDIIVKQHGGKIDVDTEPGMFTEFIITLPRTIIPQKTAGATN